MWEIDDCSFSPDEFCGVARLFPLPNLVMFPYVLQPLHVFEPRYRALVEDALQGDRLLAMGLLQAGWEAHYEERPPVEPVACLCKIATCRRLEDGRYNLMLLGLQRARMLEELPAKQSFRLQRVELLADRYPPCNKMQRADLADGLLATFKKLLPSLPGGGESLDELLCRQLSLGMLTDLIGYTLEFPLSFKQRLLAEPCVDSRAALLLAELQSGCPGLLSAVPGTRDFPPPFSAN